MAGAATSSSGPVAAITPVQDALAGEPLTISAADSCDPSGEALSYQWQVNGSPVTGSAAELPWTFAATGGYTVAVTVTNAQGESATTSTTVSVADPGVYTGFPGAPTNVVSTPAADGQSATLTWSAPSTGPPAEAYEIYTPDGAPVGESLPGAPLSWTLPEGYLPLQVEVVAVNRSGMGDDSGPVTMYADWPPVQPGSSSACTALNSMFDSYGNQGGHWTGGDTTMSVALPDGRTAWFFSDTYLGTVNPDGSRPANTPLIHNSIVVQSGSTLTTITGGIAQNPGPVVANPAQGWYWVGDGMVNGNTLQVFYHNYVSDGSGPISTSYVGTAVATFSLPSLTLQSTVTLPTTTRIDWGAALVDGQDGYTYIYGTEGDSNGTTYLHVARAPDGALADMSQWQYWTNNTNAGSNGWSTSEADSARTLTGLGTGFSVKYLNGQYVLVTMDSDIGFSPNIMGYFAASPTGPFAHQTLLYKAPEANGSTIVYDARMHPEQTCGTGFVVSYNVNSLTPGANLADVSIYRPRFITVNLPGPVTGLPDPPTDLQATVAPGTSTVSLTWTAPTGPNDTNLSYRVYLRNESVRQSQYDPLPSTVTTTSDSVTLANAGTYDFRVTAINNAGEGPPSERDQVDVTVPPPSAAPANLTAQDNPDGSVGLTWTPVTGMAGWVSYRIQASDNGGPWFTPATTAQTSSAATVTALLMGHTYRFEVQAYNSGGAGPWSAPVSTAPAVAAVTDLSATAAGDGSVALTWSAPYNGDWYWIYTCDTNAPPAGGCQAPNPGNDGYTQSVYPLGNGPGFTVTGLTGGHAYRFYVTAVSPHGGVSGASNVASATVALPTAPVLSATANNNASVSLTWTTPSSSYWYWVYSCDNTAPRAPAGGCGQPDPGNDNYTQSLYPLTVGQFTPGLLHAGDSYSYYVTSIGPGSGQSVPSNVRTVTAFFAAPTNLVATPGDGKVMLRWTAGLPGQWYWVYENGSTNPLAFPATATNTTIGGLTNGTQYTFTVTTIAPGGGESTHSNPATATPRATPPNAPTGLTATSNSNGTITLNWNKVATGDLYWIYYCDLSGSGSCGQPNPGSDGYTKYGLPSSNTSFTATGLNRGHSYIYYLQTVGTNGATSAPSDTAQASSIQAAPTNVQATANKDGSVTLSWQAPASPSGYYWIYKNGSKSTDPVFNTAQTVSFTQTGLTSGTSYQFCITAVGNAGAESSCVPSPAINITAVLAPPTGVAATVDGYGNVTVRWTTPFSGALYWLYYCDTTSPPAGGCGQPNPGQDNYTRTGPASETSANGLVVSDLLLNGDDTYSFYLTTAYGGTVSGPSGAVQVVRKLAAPTGLSGATIQDSASVGGGQCNSLTGPDCHIQLTWNAVTGADHYDIYREMITADEVSYSYVGTSYGNSFDMPIGAFAQWRASFQVKAVRSGNYGTSAASASTQMTIGDYGGLASDCYLLTSTPYQSGSSVEFGASVSCPNDDYPYYISMYAYGSVDNNELSNAQNGLCFSGNTCSATANYALTGTHSYCTVGQMTIPIAMELGGPEITATAVSRCVTLSG